MRGRIGELAERLPDALREAASADAVVGLVMRITEHAGRCVDALVRT